ncbi:MAG: terminase small subunit, partial [Nitrospirae bacterium]|nr:terminase small subunit [Nitrospirota bacterium]
MNANKLSPRQECFVQEYLTDLNASAAARRAGYAPKNADVQGPRLLGNVGIRGAIAQAMREREERVKMTADTVLAELAKIARVNMMDYMSIGPDGAPRLNWSALSRDQAAALVEVTVDEVTIGKDQGTIRRVRFRLADKVRCLEIIG